MNLVFLYNSQFADSALIKAFKDSVLTTKPVTGGNVLLRWGNPNGADENARVVLNRKQPLKNCLDKEKIFEILRINRVRRPRFVVPKPDSHYPLIGKYFNSTNGLPQEKLVTDFSEALNSGADFFVECINTLKKYNIYLFNLHVFYMTKKVPVKTNTRKQPLPMWVYEEIPLDLDRDTLKVWQLAQRAVHLLGLDFGEVHAGIDALGRPVILDVSPVPFFPPSALELFFEHVMNFIASETTNPAARKESAVLLGADPEFVLKDTQTAQLAFASAYLNKHGCLGYDERSERREGCLFPLAEIRPKPDPCPIKLTENIRSILGKAVSLIPDHIEWLAGSLHFEKYQIGGHIHFSNLDLSSRLLQALDNYLAIPIMLIEDPVTSSRRRKYYGWLGSVRIKPHGGFEYRTPASWLVTPDITRGCLCLAKIVASEYIVLRKDYFIDPDLQKAFYQCKKHYFYDIFKELWEDISNTTLYAEYARHLVPLTDLISANSHWDEKMDLRKSWGLLPPV
ncbi:MAG: hypothetical protein CVV03_04040 [Firmicutes bacterium HGW-Firmicutes-8]|nr:MAG: hypothetical protein CVV03_04040 [Firmicutes bacterium HGW-Firmicutes-8]